MMNGDELVFSGPKSQLETDRWIQNMEDHMENNPIVGKDMVQHALQCFERGAATWWRMYQIINGWQGVTTWKEFKLTLLKYQFVSQKLKPYGKDKKKTCACKLCGEEGHISQGCVNGDLVEFPTEEVEYDPLEIEALIGTEKSRKRSRLDSRKDLSHVTCYRCKESGHYFSNCPRRKPRTQVGYIITRKPRIFPEVICFRCNE